MPYNDPEHKRQWEENIATNATPGEENQCLAIHPGLLV